MQQQIQLETCISARFIPMLPPATPAEQASIDAMNHHAAEITERLQETFRLLVIEMMDIKREAYAVTATPAVATVKNILEGEDNINEGSE